MKNTVYLVKYGEIFTKGDNRYIFMDTLVKNIKSMIKETGKYEIVKEQGRIIINPTGEYDEDRLEKKLSQVFGIIGFSKAYMFDEKDFDDIVKNALLYIDENVSPLKKTFKVEAKRSDKSFPLNSPQICREVGAKILDAKSDLSVDVINPDFTLWVEVREHVYVFADTIKTAGGMPIGTNGKSLLLLSGGIDSPVAGWMIGKRGVYVEGCYFDSPPYTSEMAKQKVVDLAKKVGEYILGFKLHRVNFTEIQLYIKEKCPLDELTIIMRMLMMRISERIANEIDAQSLITGESIGQVASQTMHSLAVTNSAVKMPVFRPLIGFDKEEIVDIAKKIDTYETSILPYEDCCTLFVAKHPKTKPNLDAILKSMEALEDIDRMIDDAVNTREVIEIS
ncbi:MAG: tRNA 4-thiouridine(8) synthase ThiI [Clostridia bacterium]|nr:tRNA 4-thiouridine(8) synthase ThiI [Clostridia bacterium]